MNEFRVVLLCILQVSATCQQNYLTDKWKCSIPIWTVAKGINARLERAQFKRVSFCLVKWRHENKFCTINPKKKGTVKKGKLKKKRRKKRVKKIGKRETNIRKQVRVVFHLVESISSAAQVRLQWPQVKWRICPPRVTPGLPRHSKKSTGCVPLAWHNLNRRLRTKNSHRHGSWESA